MSVVDFSDPKIIASLTDALTAAGIDGLEISSAAGQLRIIVSAGVATRIADKTSSGTIVIKAPMAGIFCLPLACSAAVAADLPHPVTTTDVLGFLRVGHVQVPVVAGHAGLVTRRCAQVDGVVGFGETLFEIEPQS